MNISFVSDAVYPYHKGGKEKRLFELSTRLARAGHDVHIYTMHWWRTPDKARLESGVHLHAIGAYHPLYQGDRRSIAQGVLFGLACLRLARVRFEVLDVDHMPFFPIFSCWLVCVLRGKKLYGTWHEALSVREWIGYMGNAGYIAALIERISVHLPHAITAASRHTQKLIAKHLHRQRNVRLVASGIDASLMKKVQPVSERVDVLYAGRLVKDKHVDVLVRAIGFVAQYDPSVRCTIIGHGVEEPHLRQLITKLGLQQSVRIIPPLAEFDEVYAYMKAASVFCLPSVREGFGIVALEALACGTPVVTVDSAANAAKELIREGVNGSVVPLDALRFATALRTWIEREKPSATTDWAQQHDWGVLAQKQVEVYTA